MNRDQKTAVVDEIAQQLQSAQAIFAINFRGLSVAQAADLRAKLRDHETQFRVVKNSLSERAADQAGFDALKPLLVGPTALAFVQGDAALAAKTLSDTARALRLLEFKGGLLNGMTLSAEDVVSIARLPAREVLHAQLVWTVAAPITGLVRGLNGLIAGLAIALKQIADEGLVGDQAPSGAAAGAPEAQQPASWETVSPAEAGATPEIGAAGRETLAGAEAVAPDSGAGAQAVAEDAAVAPPSAEQSDHQQPEAPPDAEPSEA